MNQDGFIVPLVVAIVALVIVGGGVAYYIGSTGGSTGPEMQNDPVPTGDGFAPDEDVVMDENAGDFRSEAEIGSFTGSVTDLLARNENLTCSFEQLENGTTVAGTVYVEGRGQRLRGDVSITGPDGTQNVGHNIQSDDFNYAWFDGQSTGSKVPLSRDDIATAASDANESDILSEDFSYRCQPWDVDNEMFTLPADISFQDLTQQIQEINAGTEQVQQAQCAACDSLAGAAKDQCLQTLGC